MTTTGLRRRVAYLAVACFALAACSDSTGNSESDDNTTVDSATDNTEASTDDSTDEGSGSIEAAVEWVRAYTVSTAETATGEPLKIGFATSGDLFPEAVTAADATVAFLNENTGGANGRPVELVHCNLATPEDGTTCGTQFANDDTIVMVVVGQALFGAADFYTAVEGKKPVFTSSPSGVDDFLSTVTVAYAAGALGASFGLADFAINDLASQSIAVLITDDAAGRGGYGLIEPVLASKGAAVTPIFVAPTATAPEVEAALTAIDATTVETLIIGVFEQGCIAAYDALENLGVDSTVTNILAVKPCIGPKVQEHLASLGEDSVVPNGWYFNSFGYNPFVGDVESGVDALGAILESQDAGELRYTVAVDEIVSGIVTMVKHLIASGDDLSFATLDAAIRGFTGPAMAIAGPQACGSAAVFKSVCASRVSIDRYLDGEWIAVHSGDDSIDISPYLAPAG